MMDDLISRQAAIGYINKQREFLRPDIYEQDYIGDATYKVCAEIIERLPSAQPDGIPLEWIDKHLEWLDNCDNDFAQLAKASIKAMVEIWKKDKT